MAERYVVVLFNSRNKDNKEVKNFKQRSESYFMKWSNPNNKIIDKFKEFVKKGQKNEFCRLYISLNARDPKVVQNLLMHKMLDDKDGLIVTKINTIIPSIAARKECAIEHKWFFDFDIDDSKLANEFCQDIIAIDPTLNPYRIRTPHGYAIIVEHGFDIRPLQAAWEDAVQLKRDDLICHHWLIND